MPSLRLQACKLEEEGVIRQYTVVTDPRNSDTTQSPSSGSMSNQRTFSRLHSRLSEFSEVKFVATLAGDHTIMTEIWLADGGELKTFIAEKIRKLDGLQRVSAAVSRREHCECIARVRG